MFSFALYFNIYSRADKVQTPKTWMTLMLDWLAATILLLDDSIVTYQESNVKKSTQKGFHSRCDGNYSKQSGTIQNMSSNKKS